MTRAVITGLGVIAPNGNSPSEFWDNVFAGRVLIEDDPLMSEIGLQCHGVARCADFGLDRWWAGTERDELSSLGRFAQLGMTAAVQAMADSGLVDQPDLSGGGVMCASAVGGAPEMQNLYEALTGVGTSPIRPRPVPTNSYDQIFMDALPGLLSRRYGFRRMSGTLTTGCTAGLDALGLATELVRTGEADFVLAGAAESPLNGISYATLDVIGCLSRTDGPVRRASRPFDAGRAGFVIAEGAAFVVVESADHAVERGAHPYAEVLGFGTTSNAHHMTDLLAEGGSMARTIRLALADARLAPERIDYINAHGSSTPQNDLFETNAIKATFGAHAGHVPISSLKSMIGHSLSSASLMAVIATIGAMLRRTVPPTANYEVPDPQLDLDYVVDGARPGALSHTLVMASGFGGIHSVAVLENMR